MFVRSSLSWLVISAFCAAVLIALKSSSLVERGSVELTPQFYSDTRDQQSELCPANSIVLVAFGQSLAANSHEHVYSIAPNHDVYLYFAGRCFHLADPIMGATGQMGSVWIPTATQLATLTRKPIIVIAGGVSGSAIEQWTVPGSHLASPLRARIDEARRSGLSPNVYIWMQGENDAARGTSSINYEAHLRRLFMLFGDAPWLITSNSICTNTPTRSYVLDQARRSFAQSIPDVNVSVDLDSLGSEYRMSDRCHFNQLGQELAGTMIAYAVAQLVEK